MLSPQNVHNALQRALDMATQGHRGANPLVGAVITDNTGHIVATGYHRGAGCEHAEIMALQALGTLSAQVARTLNLLVTLEPCNHTGRTGPCAQAIANSGIGTVYYAVPDTTGAQGGAQFLRETGMAVHQVPDTTGRAVELNHRWWRTVAESRPFVTLKIAQSLDGRIAAPDSTSQWITSPAARAHAHQALRARVDAIIVGTGTVVVDNPRLMARDTNDQPLSRQPARLIMGTRKLGARPALAFDENWEQVGTHDPGQVLDHAYAAGHRHVLIEGGSQIASAFLAADLVDEIYCYQAPTILGAGLPSLNLAGVTTLSQARGFRTDAYNTQPVRRLGPDVLWHLEPLPGTR